MRHVLALLLTNVHLSCCCSEEGPVLLCQTIPAAFRPGHTSLVLLLRDVGEINSTVLRGDSLTSVSRLRIDDSGVTGVADGAFGSFRSLVGLSLERNLLTAVNPGWFGLPSVLRELNLTGNQVQVLDESTFHGFNLSRVDLSQNRITAIDPNTFKDQTHLSVLDLSDNRMTHVPPQVFSSLRHTSVRLDGNPWDCSCDAGDFVDALKDLQSRSLLLKETEVTCATPPVLRGRPAWNVSLCVTSTVQSNFTGAPTTVPNATAIVVTSETSTSDSTSSAAATSPPTGRTDTSPPARPSGSDVIPALAAVIALLCVLLVAVCLLVAPKGGGRSRRAVRPRAEEEDVEAKDGVSDTPPPERDAGFQHRDPETGWTRASPRGRARSAGAVLVTSPLGVCERQRAETEVEDKLKEGTQQPQTVTAAGDGVDEREENAHDAVNSDAGAYLSIGANRTEPEDADRQGQRSQALAMGRVSTWPPTAAQWRARCTTKQQEEATGTSCDTEGSPAGEKKQVETSDKQEVESDGTQARGQRSKDSGSASRGPHNQTDRAHVEQLQESAERDLDGPGETFAAKSRRSRGEPGAEGRSAGSSPSACTDLLHEVVRNNGRWTRQTWKRVHANQQRPGYQGRP